MLFVDAFSGQHVGCALHTELMVSGAHPPFHCFRALPEFVWMITY